MLTTSKLQAPGLTRRERDIVSGIAHGRTNREIASDLGICEQTVKNQLTCVFHKVKVRNRLELALYAVRTGLLA
jgi:two-component system, NarL family, nitrate/nitrite response regulator NarL